MKLGSLDNNVAMVVFAIGISYSRAYNKNYRPSHERFSKKYSIPLIVIEHEIASSKKHPSWQKLMVFSHPKLAGFDKVLIVDADIFITRHANNLLSVTSKALWAAVHNNAYHLPSYEKTDPELYINCPPENRPSFVLNCGMFVIDRSYKSTIESIFKDYPEQNCYEQGPLSYCLINDERGMILEPEFNTIVQAYIKSRGSTLRSIIDMYLQNSFLHFAAGKHQAIFHFLRFLDRLPPKITSILKRIANIECLNRFAVPAFIFGDRVIAFYRGRVVRPLKKLLA